MSASVHQKTESEATVLVRVRRQDASTIKQKQFYFSIVVINCKGNPNGYPIEPYIAGEKATHFKFDIPAGNVELTGSIPVKILKEYTEPCVFLQGGGYFTGKISSRPAPLVVD